jgi:secreted trypsin-like serine protease
MTSSYYLGLGLIRESEGDVPYWYLVGFASYGPYPCGMEGWPGVYTKVSSFLQWINENIN